MIRKDQSVMYMSLDGFKYTFTFTYKDDEFVILR